MGWSLKALFYITYALYKGRCLIADVFRDVVKLEGDFRVDELAGRFIGVMVNPGEEALEGCLRVSFKREELLERLLHGLRRRRVRFRVIYRGRGNVVLWFRHGSVCKLCPLVHSSGEAVPKTMLVTPMGLLFEFVSAGGGCVDEGLFDILVSGTAKEMMSYMLTPKEQEVLYHAYFRGYYSQPRRVTLEELSKELGLSKSTLNEILRSAERKIVTAYMRHDLPHLVVSKILEKIAKSKPTPVEGS
jgi:predicted DNA-binding protein (UPF0251 family)